VTLNSAAITRPVLPSLAEISRNACSILKVPWRMLLRSE
jgi:hypothetical protein